MEIEHCRAAGQFQIADLQNDSVAGDDRSGVWIKNQLFGFKMHVGVNVFLGRRIPAAEEGCKAQ